MRVVSKRNYMYTSVSWCLEDQEIRLLLVK
jgi:hypothetical protein